jgi:hypothetical protein
MRKTFFLLSLLLCFSTAKAQTTYPSPFEFRVVDSTSATADELYNRANEWVARSFKNSSSVIRLADKAAGKIIGKGKALPTIHDYFGVSCPNIIEYTFAIDVKDGKYRLVVDEFNHTGGVGSCQAIRPGGNLDQDMPEGWVKMERKPWREVRVAAKEEGELLIASFHKAMQEPTVIEVNDGF